MARLVLRNVSGLLVEPRLRAMVDIRGHPISLADGPEAAIWVTRSGFTGETVSCSSRRPRHWGF